MTKDTSRTSAQVRGDIDRGMAGDKKPGFDPSAAPLETDAEAAATPMTGQMIEDAITGQYHPDPSDWQGSRADAMRPFDGEAPTKTPRHWKTFFVIVATVVIAGLVYWLSRAFGAG